MIPLRSGSGGDGDAARLFLAASLPAFLLYLSTLAPTVTAEDSGELITAAYTLGVAHPPGYPLWSILGKLFTLIPIGTIAWRVNLLSAALGALAVGVLALIAFRFTRSFWASLTAALLFAASRDFWSQAVIAEVYTLNVLIFLLLVLFALRFEDTPRTRWLYLGAFTLGLGFTNHSTILPLAPVLFAWTFLRHRELFLKPVLMVNLVGALLAGFSIILYLPIRSAADPFMDWGDPETLSGMFDHFLRRQYTEAREPEPRTILGQGTLVLHFLGTFAAQFTLLLAPLAIFGAIENRRHERSTFRLLLVLFLLTSYGFIWLLNSTPDRQELYLTRVFYLPAFAVAAVWMALGMANFSVMLALRFPHYQRTRHAGLTLLASAAVTFLVVRHFPVNDQRGNFLAEDWGRNILEGLKPEAIIIPSQDHTTFPMAYLQEVEGLRPDVTIAGKYGYIEDRVFRDLFRKSESPRVLPPLRGTASEKEKYLIEYSGRPVYFSNKILDGDGVYELLPSGLVFEAVKKGSKPDLEAAERVWAGIHFRPGSLERGGIDFPSDIILSDYHNARGRHALLMGRVEEALEAFHASERFGFGVKEIHNNLGGALVESGEAELAIPFLKRALELDPDYDLALKNLGSAYSHLKRYREGFSYFAKVAELEPGNPVVRLAKARAHKERGEPASAYFDYLKIFRIDPRNAALRKEIEEFARAAFGKDSTLADLSAEVKRFTAVEDPFDDGDEGGPPPIAHGLPEPFHPANPASPFGLSGARGNGLDRFRGTWPGHPEGHVP